MYSKEAGLDGLPREQTLTVSQWPPWSTTQGNVIFRLEETPAVLNNDEPELMRTVYEQCRVESASRCDDTV